MTNGLASLLARYESFGFLPVYVALVNKEALQHWIVDACLSISKWMWWSMLRYISYLNQP
jgi:hypothetical protein